ncbi:MAG: tetratricopeptide repeat protein [Candidatus Methanomethyliaceae archaeon]
MKTLRAGYGAAYGLKWIVASVFQCRRKKERSKIFDWLPDVLKNLISSFTYSGLALSVRALLERDEWRGVWEKCVGKALADLAIKERVPAGFEEGYEMVVRAALLAAGEQIFYCHLPDVALCDYSFAVGKEMGYGLDSDIIRELLEEGLRKAVGYLPRAVSGHHRLFEELAMAALGQIKHTQQHILSHINPFTRISSYLLIANLENYEPHLMYLGMEATYTDILKSNDVGREILPQLLDTLLEPARTSLVLIIGVHGSGKSTLLKRLAYELWSREREVFAANAWEFDNRAAVHLRALAGSSGRPLYVLIDDAGVLKQEIYERFLTVLTEVNGPVVVVVFLTPEEWKRLRMAHVVQVQYVLPHENNEPFFLRFTPREAELLWRRVNEYGLAAGTGSMPPAMNSVGEFLSFAVRGWRGEGRILARLESLSAEVRDALKIIASFQRLSLATPVALLESLLPGALERIKVGSDVVITFCRQREDGTAEDFVRLSDEAFTKALLGLETGVGSLVWTGWEDLFGRIINAGKYWYPLAAEFLRRVQIIQPVLAEQILYTYLEKVKGVIVPEADARQLAEGWGQIFQNCGMLAEAEAMYRASLEKEAHPFTYLMLGNLQQQKSELDQAERWYREGLRVAGEEGQFKALKSSLHSSLAWILKLRNDDAEALAEIKESLKLDPKNGHAHHLYALLLAEKGDVKNAEAHHRLSLQDQRPDPLFYLDYALFLARRNRFPEAENVMRSALAAWPDDVDVLLWSARVFKQRERWLEARKCYQHLVNVAPGHAHAHLELALLYLTAQPVKDAQRAWEHAVEAYRRRHLLEGRPKDLVKAVLWAWEQLGRPMGKTDDGRPKFPEPVEWAFSSLGHSND